jgi:putative endonuclease
VRKHEAGSASRYTRSRRPVVLVWSRKVRTWKAALGLEHRIKRPKRPAKQALIAGGPGG